MDKKLIIEFLDRVKIVNQYAFNDYDDYQMRCLSEEWYKALFEYNDIIVKKAFDYALSHSKGVPKLSEIFEYISSGAANDGKQHFKWGCEKCGGKGVIMFDYTEKGNFYQCATPCICSAQFNGGVWDTFWNYHPTATIVNGYIPRLNGLSLKRTPAELYATEDNLGF